MKWENVGGAIAAQGGAGCIDTPRDGVYHTPRGYRNLRRGYFSEVRKLKANVK